MKYDRNLSLRTETATMLFCWLNSHSPRHCCTFNLIVTFYLSPSNKSNTNVCKLVFTFVSTPDITVSELPQIQCLVDMYCLSAIIMWSTVQTERYLITKSEDILWVYVVCSCCWRILLLIQIKQSCSMKTDCLMNLYSTWLYIKTILSGTGQGFVFI